MVYSNGGWVCLYSIRADGSDRLYHTGSSPMMSCMFLVPECHEPGKNVSKTKFSAACRRPDTNIELIESAAFGRRKYEISS